MPAIDSYSAILILLQSIANKCDVIEGKLSALVDASNGHSTDEDMDAEGTQEWEGSEPAPKASFSQIGSKSSSASK